MRNPEAICVVMLLVGCASRPGPVVEPRPEPAPETGPATEPGDPGPVKESIPRGFETIEALGEAFVEALNGGDPETLRTFFPPDEVVLSAVECPGVHEIIKEVKQDRESFISQLLQLGSFQVEWIGLIPRKENITNLAAGDTMQGCTVTEAITVKEVVGKYLLTEGGQTTEEMQDVAVGRFGDGRWYLLKLL
jgi:hypothetical protein